MAKLGLWFISNNNMFFDYTDINIDINSAMSCTVKRIHKHVVDNIVWKQIFFTKYLLFNTWINHLLQACDSEPRWLPTINSFFLNVYSTHNMSTPKKAYILERLSNSLSKQHPNNIYQQKLGNYSLVSVVQKNPAYGTYI